MTRLEKALLVLVLVLVAIIAYQNLYPRLTTSPVAGETPTRVSTKGGEVERAYIFMTYWDGNALRVLNQTIQEYARSKGISVRVIQVPYDEFFSRLYSSYNVGAAPDLFLAPHYYASEFAGNRIVSPIEKLPEKVASAFRGAGAVGGKAYCIPVTVDAPILLVRRDLESHLPINVEDILSANNSLGDKRILVFDAANAYIVSGWFNALGASILDRDCRKTHIGNATQVFEALLELSKTMPQAGNYIEEVEKGDAVAAIITTGRVRAIHNLGEFDIREIPAIGGRKAKPYSVLECIYVSATAKNGSQELAGAIAERVAQKLSNIGFIVAWSNAYARNGQVYYRAYLAALNSEPLPSCRLSVKALLRASECLRIFEERGWSAGAAAAKCEKLVEDVLKG